jgi:uncharacterized protein YbbK (DUF523 family)
MIRVLVSACLLGARVRYHGGDAACDSEVLARWLAEGRIVPHCPEVAGGLPTPRPPAELTGGSGLAVLRGGARVVTRDGDDVTDAFRAGAAEAVALARANGVVVAVLTEESPSCGSSIVHDGGFRGVRIAGEGVSAAALREAGIQVFSQRELAVAERAVAALERAARS